MTEYVAYFAPDATQGSVTKRIVCFQEAGFEVTSYTFRRDRLNTLKPVCENIDLGVVPDRRYLYRAVKTLSVVGRLWRTRHHLKRASIYYARMLDSAVVAILAKKLLNPRAQIYYEVCDIRRVMMDEGPSGHVARWLERRVLTSCRMLVVNSPAFVTNFYETKQRYSGPSFVLENKIYVPSLTELAKQRESNLSDVRAGADPLQIAWFGNLDCPETWKAIKSTAARFPDRVAFYLRGYPIIPEDDIRRAERELPNIEFGGPFNNRTDLADMYARVDAVLGLDLMNREGNSWWLLPNSLYEAGAFGRPLITSERTETATRVAAAGLGWVLEEPIETTLAAFIESFSWDDHARLARRIADTRVEEFAGQDQFNELASTMRSRSTSDDAVRQGAMRNAEA